MIGGVSLIMNSLKKRILEISYKYGLSHIGSCITAVDIIDEIYKVKKKDEPFILSSGHAGLALYCVIEKYLGIDAEKIWKHHGTHPDRCKLCGLGCSTGSLGQGLPIALGMAFADRQKKVWCLISDGECAEGSIWEALRIKREQKLDNLKVYCNMNGYSALGQIDTTWLVGALKAFCPDIKIKMTDFKGFDFLTGVSAHYYKLTEKDAANFL